MRLIGLALLSLLFFCGAAAAQPVTPRSMGQTLYLPIYSHIWHGDLDSRGEPTRTLMSVSISIRNTDPARPIRVLAAQYYDGEGRKLRAYLAAPRVIPPLGTFELFVPRGDDTGGSGANFVIAWKSDAPASPPVVQGFHANLPAGRAIAFTTTASPIPPE